MLDVHPPAAVATMLLSYVLPPHINILQFSHSATLHCGDPATTGEHRTLYIFSRTENQTPFIQSNIFYVKQCRGNPEQANAGDHTCCLFIHLELLLLWLHEHEQTVLRISSSACHSFRYLPEANLTTLTSLLCHATIRLTALIYQEV